MKTVVITGASRGIGRYLCDHLGPEYDVVGLARTETPGFEHRFIAADVADAKQIVAGLKELELKRVYGLLNFVGTASMNLFMTTPSETISQIIQVNTIGTMNACSALLPLMIRNRQGRVVNVSTIAAGIGLEGESVYVASKAAVEAFSRVLAKEVASYKITVNVISPNPIHTDLIKGVGEKRIQELIQTHQAVKRKGTHEDVLNVVRFYLAEESGLITGQNLTLGGY